jgi:hypothetical protein
MNNDDLPRKIGNCSHIIDWELIITNLEKHHPPVVKKGRPEQWMESTGVPLDHPVMAPWKEYIQRLDNSNYNFSATEWFSYDSGIHFDQDVDLKICDFFKVKKRWSVLHKVNPGCNCPTHIDNEEDDEIDQSKKIRYIIKISPPVNGQLLHIENRVFHNLEVGDVILWNNYQQWHSVTNCSNQPMYLYSLEAQINE